ALCLYTVQNFSGYLSAVNCNTTVDNIAQLLFAYQEANLKVEHMLWVVAVNISQILRDGLVEDNPAHSGIYQLALGFAVYLDGTTNLNGSLQSNQLRS